jgi:hypothetical protein
MALRRNNIILYKRIQERFKELYQEQKLRYDYVLELLEKEFCKASGTLQHILRYDLPRELPETNPTQMKLFSESHSTSN